MIFEVWLLTALGLMLSTFTAPLSSAIYTFCLALIGHASTSIWQIAQKSPAALKYILDVIYYLFPNLEKFNLRNEVVYAINPPFSQVWTTVVYFIGYTALLLVLGLMAFRSDEF